MVKFTMKQYNVFWVRDDGSVRRSAFYIHATDEHGAIRGALEFWADTGIEIEAGMIFEVVQTA